MLEGGGKINGAFLRAGLIDEVSLLVAPVVDGRIGLPTAFDILGDDVASRRVALEEAERRADDVLWLRYPGRVADRPRDAPRLDNLGARAIFGKDSARTRFCERAFTIVRALPAARAR
jgi:RibD C-terminal domain